MGVIDGGALVHADSPFEETVATFIKSRGHKVDKQVGSAGFKIDLAVRHPDQPGRYMLAVECDGATYHSGLWARERDRLRQEILENMGCERGVMGHRAHDVLDDLYANMKEASSPVIREKVWKWYSGTIHNRLEPNGAIILINHRMPEAVLLGSPLSLWNRGCP